MSIPILQFITPTLPTWYPFIISLHLCLYFSFVNKIICIIFLDSTNDQDFLYLMDPCVLNTYARIFFFIKSTETGNSQNMTMLN